MTVPTTMSAKSPKAGQFFRLTPNGLWTSQDVNPLWSDDSTEYFKANKYHPEVSRHFLLSRISGGLFEWLLEA